MPKIAKCLKCLKLMSAFGGSILLKEKSRVCYYDLYFLMLKMPGVYNKDGA